MDLNTLAPSPIDILPPVDVNSPGYSSEELQELSGTVLGNSGKPLLLWVKKSSFSLSKGVNKKNLKLSASNPDIPEEAAKDVQMNIVNISKKIIKSKYCDAIVAHDAMTMNTLKSESLPPYYRRGLFLIPLSEAFTVQKYLKERIEERQELIETLKSNYDNIIKEMAIILGPIFSYNDYPLVDKVIERYTFIYKFFNFDVPLSLKSVSLSLYEQEKKKSDEYWSSLREEIKKALLLSYDGLVGHLVESLQTDGEGKKKRFSMKAIEKMQYFIETFTAKNNVTDYTELAELVEQSKLLFAGVDISAMRKDSSVKNTIVSGFEEIRKKLDIYVEEVGGRSYSFVEEEEDNSQVSSD